MKIGLYNPYFDSLGGGERYTLTLASHWSKQHDVDLFWSDFGLLDKAQKRFNLDLSRVHVVEDVFKTRNLFTKLVVSRKYDCIFFLTDGSVPTSLATFNILHFQVPFAHVNANPLALARMTHIVCNSMYTVDHIDSRLRKRASVIYPPVSQVPSQNMKKKKVILSVGRFTPVHQAKKQLIMIEAFIEMEKRIPDWTLVLAGGLLSRDAEYLLELKTKAAGHQIVIQENISYEALREAYKTATLYWHAAGFGESDPMYHEHFGITTVEAASAGAVPLVYAGGGQKEIIRDGVNGLLWNTPLELIEKTLSVIADSDAYASLQKEARLTWKRYSTQTFERSYDALLASFIKS